MKNYLPIETNLTNNKPAFLKIDDIIMCPTCNNLSKLSFLHAVLFEKKDKTSHVSKQYFCFECNSIITIEKEVFLMDKHMHVYSYERPKTNASIENILGRGENGELSKEEINTIINSWKNDL